MDPERLWKLSEFIRPRKVCLCKNVSQDDIVSAFNKGAKTITSVVKKTKATTGCGTCLDEVTDLVQFLQRKEKEKKIKQEYFKKKVKGVSF